MEKEIKVGSGNMLEKGSVKCVGSALRWKKSGGRIDL